MICVIVHLLFQHKTFVTDLRVVYVIARGMKSLHCRPTSDVTADFLTKATSAAIHTEQVVLIHRFSAKN